MKIDRNKVWNKYGCKCAYCGEDIKFKEMQIDHIIPKANFWSSMRHDLRIPSFLSHLTLGDLNHVDNLNPSCRQCNFYKSSHHLEGFRDRLLDIHYRIMKPFISRLGAKYGIVKMNTWDGIFYFEK